MKKEAGCYHVPVMLEQCIESLIGNRQGTYLDVTFGGGGHSRAILKALGENGHLYGFDQDEDALNNVPDDERFTFVLSNFRYLKNWMRYYDVEAVDGILADLGVSSHHFDVAERGFSFREDGPLDMRMNRKMKMTAADVLNNYDADALAQIFWKYGELRQSRQLATCIVKYRETTPFSSVSDLLTATEKLVGKGREKKDMAKVFQALRIEVNHEMDALEEMLLSACEMLRPGGRLVVLTYHSLEDRIVKNMMRSGNVEGKVKQDFYGNRMTPFRSVYNKVILPSVEEQEKNPRSRSAKLRVAERVEIVSGKE